MGWTATYQVLLDRPLSEAERRALGALVARVNRPRWDSEAFSLALRRAPAADGVIAQGWNKLGMNLDESPDAARLVAALNEVRALLPGAEVRLRDDFGAFGVEADGKVALGARASSPPVKVDEAELESIEPWLPTEGGEPPAETLRRLASISAERVVREGFDRYDELRGHETWGIVAESMKGLEDVAPIVPGFLKVWGRLEGIYWHHDMWFPESFVARLVAEDEVRARLEADVREADAGGDKVLERVYRRAEKAIALLSHGDPARLAALVAPILRRTRARADAPHDHRYRVYLPALEALARRAADPALFATLVLELDRMTSSSNAHLEVARALVRLDRPRGRDVAMRLAVRWTLGWGIVGVMEALGDDEDARAWIDRWETAKAAATDVPETMAVHPCEELRHKALRALHERKDRALFLGLAAAESVDAILRKRTDSPGLPFSWFDWKGVIPDQVIQYRPAEKLNYARRSAKASMGEQIVWAAVAEIVEKGAMVVAEAIPPTAFRLTDEERAAYVAEEARALG